MATRYRNAFAAPSGFVTAAPGSSRSAAEAAEKKGRAGASKTGALRSSGSKPMDGPRTKAA